MKVTVKESSMVRPSEETPKHALACSNLDLARAIYHTKVVFMYRPIPTPNNKCYFDPSVLKNALSIVLVPFYPLAGRLGKDKENGRYNINCNGEGVLFVVAQSESSIDDFADQDFTPCIEFENLIPTLPVDTSNHPLLLVQITFFKCGGVCLGVGIHHTLADGISGLHFINSWSEVARGVSITVQPYFDRTLLNSRNPPIPKYHHAEYDQSPTMITLQKNTECPSNPETTSTLTVRITSGQIAILKAKVKAEAQTRTGNKQTVVRYSTYETIAAHMWQCMCIARGLADDQPTRLYVVTDGRSRLNPPIRAGYFGNVVFSITVEDTAGDIISKPLIYTVEKIHDSVVRRDNDYMRSILDFLELQLNPTTLARGAHYYKCPNLRILSWITLPIYDPDFGWGRPIHVGPTNLVTEGSGYILPSPTKDGSFSILTCLEKHHMEIFRKVFFDHIETYRLESLKVLAKI